nr:Stf0 family sulfotransferase [Microbacterium sp. G2-8]
MLGHLLHATNQLGHPLEYLHPVNFARWKELYATSDAGETIRQLMRNRTSPSGVFSTKIHYPQLAAFGGIAALREHFPDPHVVLLRRRDSIKQAVSLAIARQTGKWIGETPSVADVQYDAHAIDRALADVILQTANWRRDVLRSDLPVLELDFEDILGREAEAVASIAAFAGVEVPAGELPAAPSTRRQGSSLNAEWRARFLADVARSPSDGTSRFELADGGSGRSTNRGRAPKRAVKRLIGRIQRVGR